MNNTEQMPCGHHGPRPIKILVGLVLAFFLITLSANNIKQYHVIGLAPEMPHTITVSGSGKITATPTIATTDVGLVTEKTDVASAQTENSQKMNALIAAVQGLGIAKEDMQTAQYQIFPKYTYDQKGGSQIVGYTVSQSVTIKIRDLSKISDVLAKAGAAGANQVSGVQFTFDEPQNLQASAREKAVADAKENAQKLAAQLGVQLGSVVGFSENGGNVPGPIMYARTEAGVGGPAPMMAPDVQAGSLDVNSNVDLTFEIK